MSIDPQALNVVNNRAENRFEVVLERGVALTQYRLGRSRMAFMHTEVPPPYQGQGVAERIVRTGLDYARSNGLKVLPYCPFVRSFIRRHQEYQDLVYPGFKDPG